MKTFKTLAEFKRVLQVGDTLKCTRFGFNPVTYPPREVAIKQTNSFALKTKQASGEIVNSWLEFPKASKCKIENNELTIIDNDGNPWLTYSFAE